MGRLFDIGSVTYLSYLKDVGFGLGGNSSDLFYVFWGPFFRYFHGAGESLARYEKEVELWNHITTSDVMRRGPLLVPQMADRPQEICMALGRPKLIGADGATGIMTDALDAVY